MTVQEEKNLALEGIRKKLVGRSLSYKEIYAIMDEIAKERLGDVLTTYFVASGYSKGFSNDEIYYLTKAMIETGEQLEFKGIVADKHSIGGSPGTRTTLLVVPIIAAAGFTIPKSSSRAITTPAGTADSMETLAKVTFTKEEIYKIVEKTNGCIVWGGSFKIAPADDDIIRIEEPLLFESFDKILVSIMAKKIAFGSNHVVIDLPYGSSMKVRRREDAEVLGKKFEYIASRFHIKIKVIIHRIDEPASRGVGPLLEAREALKVLEQTEDRSHDLEKKSIELCSILLSLCLEDASPTLKKQVSETYVDTKQWAHDILVSGKALAKMREIIKAQKGNPDVSSKTLVLDSHKKEVKYEHASGKITKINNKNLTVIAKLLGAPHNHKAGIYMHKMLDETVHKGDTLYTFYSNSSYNIQEAQDSLHLFPIIEVE